MDDELTKTLIDHSKTLAEHSSRLDQHAQMLGELGALTRRHDEAISNLQERQHLAQESIARIEGMLGSLSESIQGLRDGMMKVTLYAVLALIVVAIGTRAFEAFVRILQAP